jgi:hypothetical protein
MVASFHVCSRFNREDINPQEWLESEYVEGSCVVEFASRRDTGISLPRPHQENSTQIILRKAKHPSRQVENSTLFLFQLLTAILEHSSICSSGALQLLSLIAGSQEEKFRHLIHEDKNDIYDTSIFTSAQNDSGFRILRHFP